MRPDVCGNVCGYQLEGGSNAVLDLEEGPPAYIVQVNSWVVPEASL